MALFSTFWRKLVCGRWEWSIHKEKNSNEGSRKNESLILIIPSLSVSFLVRWANNKILSRQKWSCHLQAESWVTQNTRLFMTQALVIFLPILWPLIPSKNTYLDTHSYKCASLCLKSVLQPYRVLLFSHALISIFDIFESFKQTYGPCSSFIWAQGEGQVVAHVILVLPEIHVLLITTHVLYKFWTVNSF